MDHVGAAAIVFLCVYVLFFSSFFTNFPQGLVDSLATFTIWTQTGAETQVAPPQQYLVWMAIADAPILILGTIGGIIAAVQGRSRLWVFIGLWALGITLAYSFVSYKTPWIVLNMLVPLALLGGLAVREAAVSPRWRPAAVGAVVLATAASAFLAYDLNYVNYDTDDSSRYPYVYVHSTREMLTMLDQIEDIAAEEGTGTDTGITIVSPDYWPLPWYLRDYPKAGFWGRIEDVPLDQPVIVANANQREQLQPLIAGRFEQAGTYKLRPGCRARRLRPHGRGGVMTRRSAVLRLLIGVAISAVFLALTLSRVNLAEVGAAIAAASPAWLLAALGIVIDVLLRALRWQFLLHGVPGAGTKPPYRLAVGYLMIGFTANAILPRASATLRERSWPETRSGSRGWRCSGRSSSSASATGSRCSCSRWSRASSSLPGSPNCAIWRSSPSGQASPASSRW